MTNSKLDAENLLEHVKILATKEGRSPGTAGHDRARKYLCSILKHMGLTPYSGDSFELVYGTGTNKLINIIAVAPGKNRRKKPVLLAAHYDTFGERPGADDNAAGNAILIEIGKELMKSPAECDVILAFFDGEELGSISMDSIGSVKFYKKQCTKPVRCALVLDLVGHDIQIPGLEDMMIVTGMESSSTWSPILKSTEPKKGLRWATVLDSYVGSLSDHHIYAKNEEPFLFFSCGRWEHYHEKSDTYDKLSYSKMAVFKSVLLSIVRAAAESEPKRGMYDSAEDEVYFLNKNLLPALGFAKAHLKTRKDVDALVSLMLSQFTLY